LNGTGNFHFTDGALKGRNIAAMMRNIGSAFQQPSANEKTDFSELSGTFTIAGGIVHNSDLSMKSPLLRVTGAGDADLPNTQIHYMLKPEVVGTLQGQGGKDAGGIVVPVRIEGPLNNPSYTPDLQAALQENLKNPQAVKDTLKSVKGNAKDLKSKLKGLLGGGQ
jgi:AsmA protein